MLENRTPCAPPNGIDLRQLSRRRVSPRHANRGKCRDVRLGVTDLRPLSPGHSSLRRRELQRSEIVPRQNRIDETGGRGWTQRSEAKEALGPLRAIAGVTFH